MYSIIFHIAGIAILEICFYFYYIGPVESKMFETNILLLLNDPLDEYNKLYIQYPIQQIIANISEITNITGDKIIKNIYEEYKVARYMREKQNYDLFMYTIKYWCMLLGFGIFIYGLKYKYNLYKKKQKVSDNVIIDIVENSELLRNTQDYRKNSIDESDIEQESEHIIIQSPHKIYRNKIIYYVSFGSCVLFFEYIFFQYIVLFYNPLSNHELRYIILKSFLND
jgi:hypothetical protein